MGYQPTVQQQYYIPVAKCVRPEAAALAGTDLLFLWNRSCTATPAIGFFVRASLSRPHTYVYLPWAAMAPPRPPLSLHLSHQLLCCRPLRPPPRRPPGLRAQVRRRLLPLCARRKTYAGGRFTGVVSTVGVEMKLAYVRKQRMSSPQQRW